MIRACVRAGIAGFSFDAGIIRTAVPDPRPTRAGSPVQVDAEFRVVRVGEREFRFRGDKQRQVVKHLYGAWDRNEGRVSAAFMFSELELSSTTRLRDLFKGHGEWKDLIGYEDGACWLKCDELLTPDAVSSD